MSFLTSFLYKWGEEKHCKGSRLLSENCAVEGVITQVFLEVVEKESIPEVTTNQPSDAESSQSASREGSLFMIYLCS